MSTQPLGISSNGNRSSRVTRSKVACMPACIEAATAERQHQVQGFARLEASLGATRMSAPADVVPNLRSAFMDGNSTLHMTMTPTSFGNCIVAKRCRAYNLLLSRENQPSKRSARSMSSPHLGRNRSTSISGNGATINPSNGHPGGGGKTVMVGSTSSTAAPFRKVGQMRGCEKRMANGDTILGTVLQDSVMLNDATTCGLHAARPRKLL
mmetsp:Transcript_10775/g.25761  ORF Transcript_10775/g.25761 Transcript_10775/m.25761 type:complete len:210 (-) Transcript_10775:30-659(-)